MSDETTKTFNVTIFNIIQFMMLGAAIALGAALVAGMMNRPVDAYGVTVAFNVCKNADGIKTITNGTRNYTFVCANGITMQADRKTIRETAASYRGK